MLTIYKSCSPKYTAKDIENLSSGTTSFASFERLMSQSIKGALVLTDKEKIVGMKITADGIKFYIERIEA